VGKESGRRGKGEGKESKRGVKEERNVRRNPKRVKGE
jgi:hypothetical protein